MKIKFVESDQITELAKQLGWDEVGFDFVINLSEGDSFDIGIELAEKCFEQNIFTVCTVNDLDNDSIGYLIGTEKPIISKLKKKIKAEKRCKICDCKKHKCIFE